MRARLRSLLLPRRAAVFATLVVVSAFWIYQPALRGAWQWDDSADVSENSLLRSTGGLVAIWFHPTALADYYPIKYTVQWVQWHLWADHTLGYHVTNVALHALSALLLWRLLRQLHLRFAWAGALLFVVHPLTVESVAWIAELKNTLSLPPLLLAASALFRYADDGNRRDWIAALLWFSVSMLCKTAAVLFPVFALVVLWWKHGAIRWRACAPLAPFFIVSLGAGIVTLVNQHRALGALPVELGGVLPRVLLCASSIGFYLRACLLPNPMPLYPQWPLGTAPAADVVACAVVLGASVWAWRHRTTWGRHALLGIAWFLLLILPFTGLAGASYMHFTWVMDHLAYAALPGLLALFTAGLDALLSRPVPPPMLRALAPLGAAILVVFATASRTYAAAFGSYETLWRYALQKNSGAWYAHYCLGVAFGNMGRLPEAEAEYEAALAINPAYPPAHDNLGIILSRESKFPAAVAHLRTALASAPNLPPVENDLGIALSHAGAHEEAIRHLRHVLELKPDYAEARSNLGSALLRAGRSAEAEVEYQAACALAPATVGLRYNLGLAQQACGHWQDAADSFRAALAQNPQSAAIQHDLAACLAKLAAAATRAPGGPP